MRGVTSIFNDDTICDYCLQKTGCKQMTILGADEEERKRRNVCDICMIRMLDKVFGIPEHKTEEMEKMFVID